MEFDIYINGRCNRNDDLYFLKILRNYEEPKEKVDYKYIFSDKRLKLVNELIPKAICEQATKEFDLQCHLMHWVRRNLLNGNDAPVRPFNTLNILEKTKESNFRSSCWVHAVVLNEVFLSFGFRSRMVRCLPLDLRPIDCHCVTLCYSNDYQKWIVYDSAMGTIYTNKDKVPLSLREMRYLLITQQEIKMPFVLHRTSQNLRWYLIKNMIRFQSYQTSCFNMEENEIEQTIFCLNPAKYQLEDKIVIDRGNKVYIKNVYNEDDFWGVESGENNV
ncbi:MAG TPA: transglutaminase-like domain-containing protein [Candidatus Eisenbergiella stercoravium]|nr:transglutaminase-like domain-containing protein [Candidatus Eisenbergiella stercoravium]